MNRVPFNNGTPPSVRSSILVTVIENGFIGLFRVNIKVKMYFLYFTCGFEKELSINNFNKVTLVIVVKDFGGVYGSLEEFLEVFTQVYSELGNLYKRESVVQIGSNLRVER